MKDKNKNEKKLEPTENCVNKIMENRIRTFPPQVQAIKIYICMYICICVSN